VLKRPLNAQLRAYVFPRDGSIKNKEVYDGLLLIGTIFAGNSGQTPAYRFTSSVHMNVFDRDTPSFTEDKPSIAAPSIIAPDSEMEITVKFGPIPIEEFHAINSGTKGIFIWGRFDYIDAFDRPRYFKFYIRSGNRTSGGLWSIRPDNKPQESD
jgi:hypothetical protein